MDIYVLQLSQDSSKIKSNHDNSCREPAVRMTSGVERTGNKDANDVERTSSTEDNSYMQNRSGENRL
jgi:hypothetical protein